MQNTGHGGMRSMTGKRSAIGAAVGLALLLALPALAAAQDFTNFETGQVRPMALSPDGSQLFVTNTPDGYLEVFDLGSGTPVHACSISVGLEPLAVAARTNDEVWVVNHLSDSVSVVDVSGCATGTAAVTRTIQLGDEARDIVFAGPGGNRAFITTAHRGQDHPNDPQLTTEGVGRADVWVFDASVTAGPLLSNPLTIVQLFGDTPRALAVSPDGSTVYAGVFHSGNQTTVINETLVCDGGAGVSGCTINGNNLPGGLPAPNDDIDGNPQPEVSLIVKWNSVTGAWEDELGRSWNEAVRFELPDLDVFAIDAMAAVPNQVDDFAGVGTILFNMVTNPATGMLYVSNNEALNEVRFEGPGTRSTTVRGHTMEAQITVIDPTNGSVTPRHLNPHVDFNVIPSDAATKARSLATPVEMAISSDGATLYLAAFGSGKIAIVDTAELEAGTFAPETSDQVILSAGGPSGVVLDEARNQLYVHTRFDNGLSVVSLATDTEIAHVALHNPEPPAVILGRPFLYDANISSSTGTESCSSCHVFGDFDSLAWDLGVPDEHVVPNLNTFELSLGATVFHPNKGPMTTQSFRGMANHGPLHWRGDRTRSDDEPSAQPDSGTFDENGAFLEFNPAFVGLLGRETELTAGEMQAFANFALAISYPPNPIRGLDNSLSAVAEAGRQLYFGRAVDGGRDCNGCHTLDRALGFFGTDGQSTFEGETQEFKIAHLRNMYQKVGMFGLPRLPNLGAPDTGDLGPQVRGFGFLHDGSIDTLFRFLAADVFAISDLEQRNLEAFMMEFDSELFPIVGQQLTEFPGDTAAMEDRVDLMQQRALLGECDLIAKGIINGEMRGSRLLPNNMFETDRAAEEDYPASVIRGLPENSGVSVTYTCVPPGSGQRMGIDRDLDGFFDGDELDAGTNPADPTSFPGAAVCGNGIVESGEQCDAGSDNGTGNSCCQADCQFKPDGAATCDGSLCTIGDVCNAGVCTPGSCNTGNACSACGGTCSLDGGGCECIF